MSTMPYRMETGGVDASERILPIPSDSPPLHRIGEVRRQQGLSVRSAARRLDKTVQEIHMQEDPRHDLSISDLLRWQETLEVPLADLLVDTEAPLSVQVCHRANLLKIMKTAKAVCESAKDPSVRRLATMLVDQLIGMMPELAEVAAWHTVGQRRTQDEMGRIVERTISDNFFNEVPH